MTEFTRLAELAGHQVQQLAALPYGGGSDRSEGKNEMLWLAFRVTRDEYSTMEPEVEEGLE